MEKKRKYNIDRIKELSLGNSFCLGLPLGVLIIISLYTVVLLPIVLILMLRRTRSFNLRKAYSFFLGVLTPIWICLPIWLFMNILLPEVPQELQLFNMHITFS